MNITGIVFADPEISLTTEQRCEVSGNSFCNQNSAIEFSTTSLEVSSRQNNLQVDVCRTNSACLSEVETRVTIKREKEI